MSEEGWVWLEGRMHYFRKFRSACEFWYLDPGRRHDYGQSILPFGRGLVGACWGCQHALIVEDLRNKAKVKVGDTGNSPLLFLG